MRRLFKSTMAAALCVAAMGSAGAAPALADGSMDLSCSGAWGIEDCRSGSTHGYVRWTGPGRCDVTIKFLGGAASAMQAQYYEGFSDVKYPWSPWLRVNETWSRAFWDNVGIIGWAAYSAQWRRAANYRIRAVGPCYVSNW
jgi:hypothetical protein